MGLLTFIQIPCHHVLANEIALSLKYRIGLKQFLNINFGIGIIKNCFFCLYFWHVSLCFYSNFNQENLLDAELNHIQRVPTHLAYFWRTPLPQKQEIPEKTWWWHMSKIRTKKVVFFYDTYPQIYIKKVFKTYTVFQT